MEERGYSVIRALGQGGCQCRVYEVHDKEGRLRVLKQLPWAGEDDRVIAMREVHLLASLRHPCIVPYLESFLVRSTPSMPSEDILCLVMKRCERDLRQECIRLRLEWELQQGHEDSTIDQALPRQSSKTSLAPRFKEQQVLSWLAQLCWGLQHLHSRKFLHRDLKPQNVLLTHGGRRAMLADFGVAGQVECTEGQRQSIVGTPAFMSPEMLEGRPYGLKTDQWALGCVLFEMMALEPPFASRGESYASVVSAVLQASHPKVPAGYSHDLNQALERLLARKPHERPSNRELLCSKLLRATFHTFVQSLEQAAVLAGAGSQTVTPPLPSARTVDGNLERFQPTEHSGEASYSASSYCPSAQESSSPHTSRTATAYIGSLRGTVRNAVGISGVPGNGSGAAPTVDDETPASIASSHAVSVPGTDAAETDAYVSDFESLSPGESPTGRVAAAPPSWIAPESYAPPTSAVREPRLGGNPSARQPAGLGAAAARVLRQGGDSCLERWGVVAGWPEVADCYFLAESGGDLSVRDDLDSSSDGTAANASLCIGGLAGLSQQVAGDSLGDVGLCTDGWRNLLAEAESLLQAPAMDADAAEEAAKARAALVAAFGAPAQVDRALGFLRDRRPLGETAEADELLLQVELLDLLGEEGLKQLPLLEQLLALEGSAPSRSAGASMAPAAFR